MSTDVSSRTGRGGGRRGRARRRRRRAANASSSPGPPGGGNGSSGQLRRAFKKSPTAAATANNGAQPHQRSAGMGSQSGARNRTSAIGPTMSIAPASAEVLSAAMGIGALGMPNLSTPASARGSTNDCCAGAGVGGASIPSSMLAVRLRQRAGRSVGQVSTCGAGKPFASAACVPGVGTNARPLCVASS